VVARKSFSKLRSAIGGLYRSRGRFREAERAFQQARILYPLSPEANFRLVQEVFMSERRFGEARELMQEFGAQDPGNVKVPEFLDQLGKLETLDKRMMDLEAKMGKGALDVNEAIDLLQIYQQSGQIPRFASLASSLLQNTNLPSVYLYRLAYLCSSAKRTTEMGKALDLCMANMPTNAPAGIYLDMAKLYAGVHNAGKMTECLVRYLRVKPSDWKAWLDLTTMQMVLNRDDEASASLEQAVRYGGPEAMETIRQDDRFKPIRDRVFKRARNLMGFPGFKTAPEDPF
jgi:tetratricopeptide (TPR) repeat protein